MPLEKKIEEFLRDVRWVISTSEKPSPKEFNTVVKFLLFLVFAAGVIQFIFYIANVYMTEYLLGPTTTYALSPTQEAVAVASSLGAIFAVLIYIMIKFG
ncbi:Sec translocase subunit gamma [Thermoproteus tenax]|uniref:Sec translocase gamma subunit, Sec61gamma n=1 Tax=Thermoproteus tenax (strain ATCC 35583 / DSM 2078 / JCM 9277 / NBRC 100435 / Kra 1) TaxID=768679 RepID=G4RLI4_THETK|nr:Sec translocase subunit gamma [Thermoproteus tenax]CCC82429.1 Sec translocase gamma subunit, Sec61gamma [Thermoproteus tenax Kra 1]